MSGRRSSRAPRDAGRLTLSDEWRVWVADNLLAGVAPGDLIATLAGHGVPEDLARAEVDAIHGSPAWVACRRLSERVRRLEMMAALQKALAATAPCAGRVERRPRIAAEEFFEHYYAAQRPVILTDVVTGWPAYRRWSPAYFKKTLGDVEVEIVSGRAADADYDRNFDRHRETTTMADYVDRVLAAGTSNDLYMIAHNRTMSRPELSVLFDDIAADEAMFDPARFADGGTTLWFGPAGTVTPLHHDPTNILFCQIYGKKRITLIAPWETSLLVDAQGFYAAPDVDLEDPGARSALADAGVVLMDEELAAGEALFIPAGMWHHVKAVEVSITFSLLAFRRPNTFDWYRPGAPE